MAKATEMRLPGTEFSRKWSQIRYWDPEMTEADCKLIAITPFDLERFVKEREQKAASHARQEIWEAAQEGNDPYIYLPTLRKLIFGSDSK